MRFQKGESEVELCGSVREMQGRVCRPEFATAVVGRSGRKKAASSFSRTSRVNDVQLCTLAGVGGEANKVICVDVFKASLSDKAETDAIAERKVTRSGCALGRSCDDCSREHE